MLREHARHLQIVPPTVDGRQEVVGGKMTYILTGPMVAALDPLTQRRFSRQISAGLAANPDTMRQFTPLALAMSMKAGEFVVKVDEDLQLQACAQVRPMAQNPTVMEVGTWLNFSE